MKKNQFDLIECRSEICAGTRGSSLGIDAIKVAARNQGSHFFAQFSPIVIKDENQLLDTKTDTPCALRIEPFVNVHSRLSKEVNSSLRKGRFPFVLTADHGNGSGVFAGIKSAYPDKKLGLIWIDAHADLHTPYTTPSGNIHGMPLGLSLGLDNLDKKRNTPNKKTVKTWEKLKKKATIGNPVSPTDLVFFGVRDTEPEEDFLIEKYQIRNFGVEELRERGIPALIDELKVKLEGCDIVYLSFDVDSMDCDLVSRGTGTPVPNGFSKEETVNLVGSIVDQLPVVVFEITEVNPTLDDKKNKMAEAAFQVLDNARQVLGRKLGA